MRLTDLQLILLVYGGALVLTCLMGGVLWIGTKIVKAALGL